MDEPSSDPGFSFLQKPTLHERINSVAYGFLDAVSNCLSIFPANPITNLLQGAWLMMRRSFFNQAPTLKPSQTTGQVHGAITGTLGAVDPEGDSMMYGVLQNPVDGTVNINPDGTFTYTPGSNFDGRDVFIVEATDTSRPSFNVLEPFSPGVSEALVTVTQTTAPLVDYAFTFKQSAGQRWSTEAELGLKWAAYNLADTVVPKQAVTLTITATAQYLTGKDADTLASARSPLTSTTAGFFPTVVQSRIQTGSPSVVDKNGKAVPDGIVNVNFNNQWGYEGVVKKIVKINPLTGKPVIDPDTGEEVLTGEYDYESVLMHELMHAYGFTSTVQSAGNNGSGPETWSTFAKFVTDSSGTPAIPAVGPNAYVWNSDFDANLTGGNGGLYFYGTDEAIAFGGKPVPLYTPSEWEPGSSMGHLNDAFFNNTTNPNDPRYIQLMNARDNPGIKAPDYLSAVEVGILKDIGYTMNSPTPAPAAANSPL